MSLIELLKENNVRIHVDTADPDEIKEIQGVLTSHGLSLAGYTSNPSLICNLLEKRKKDGTTPDIVKVLNDFVSAVPGTEPSIEPPGLFPKEMTVDDLTKPVVLEFVRLDPETIHYQADHIMNVIIDTVTELGSRPNIKVPVSVL